MADPAPKVRPAVFVGSSSEGLEVAKSIQVNLDPSGEVEIWNQGVFGLSQGTLESLVNASSRFDFAVFILTADDLVISRGMEHQTARDNVLLELGIFLGKIGRERTFIVYDQDNPPKLPSDLAGVTFATFRRHTSGNLQSALGASCIKIELAIESLGARPERLAQAQQSLQLEILTPTDGAGVSHKQLVRGLVRPIGTPVQILVYSAGDEKWWLQEPATYDGQSWQARCYFGLPNTMPGAQFRVVAIDGNIAVKGESVANLPVSKMSNIVNVMRKN